MSNKFGRVTPDTLTVDGTPYVRAYPVPHGRCAHCGNLTRRWTPARILHALQAWADHHGHTPSATKLATPGPEYPSTRVVCDYFGSWDGALQAAGFPASPHGAGVVWTRERILGAMAAWGRLHGDAPTAKDWLRSTPEHPAARTVLTRFGTWNTAIDEAGFFPRGPWGRRLRPSVAKPRGVAALVDSGPVADAVRGYLGPDGSVEVVAELVGLGRARLHEFLSGERVRMLATTADRILTAIDRPDVLTGLEAA